MSAPVLTVAIPCSNSERFLHRSLGSMRGIEPRKVEVIVVDNQSSDQTLQVVAAYSDIVTRVISERDRGQSDALNKALAHATGDFYCWLNSDDEFVADALPRVVSVLEAADADWYTAGMVWIDEADAVLRCSPPLPYSAFLRGYGASGIGGPSSFVRRTALEKVGGFDEALHYSMDTDMWHRLHSRGVGLRTLQFYAWAFRLHEGSKTSHIHLGRPMIAGMHHEHSLLGARHGYGVTLFDTLMLQLGTRIAGLWSGRDIRAWRDTRRYRGRHVSAIGA
jgi:glycosyltransferase involved in cell wall biosynthesis